MVIEVNFFGSFMVFEERLEEVNQTLSKVSIRQRGEKLSIRGTFTSKPDDGNRPKSQEISTGKPATPAGLRMTVVIAQEIDSLLVRDKFEWEPYLKGKQKPAETVGEWLEKFEAAHWNNTPLQSRLALRSLNPLTRYQCLSPTHQFLKNRLLSLRHWTVNEG